MGNSIGSQVAAAVAAAHPQSVAALCLLNCTGAMNARGLYQDDPRLLLLMPVFAAFETALRIPAIATLIFSNFRSRTRVASLLTSPSAAVYANQEAVDDELLDILTEPAADPGAQNVFVQVFTGDPGQRPEVSMAQVTCPVQVQVRQWSIRSDGNTYLSSGARQTRGRPLMGRWQSTLGGWQPSALSGWSLWSFLPLDTAHRCVPLGLIPLCGNLLQDDRPELVLGAMVPWLQRVVS